MKKVQALLFIITIYAAFLLTGCESAESATERAQAEFDNGNYSEVVNILEPFTENEAANSLFNEAYFQLECKNSILEAQNKIDSFDYKSAISLLEGYRENSDANELYISAVILQANTFLDSESYDDASAMLLPLVEENEEVAELYKETYTAKAKSFLTGNWEYSGYQFTDKIHITVTFNKDSGVGLTYYIPENVSGYIENDKELINITISEETKATAELLAKNLGGDCSYLNVSIELDYVNDEFTICCADGRFILHRANASEELEPELLTITSSGAEIRRNDLTAYSYIGLTSEQMAYNIDNENSGYAYYIPLNYRYYIANAIVYEGGFINDEIYCGMSISQLKNCKSLQSLVVFNDTATGVITDLNGNEIQINFKITDNLTTMAELDSEYYYNENERLRIEEENNKYNKTYYSTEGLHPVGGLYAGDGFIEAIFPYSFFGTYFYVENPEKLEYTSYYLSDLVSGFGIETGEYVTYGGYTLPVYHVVTVVTE